MKLVTAIVHNEDAATLVDALLDDEDLHPQRDGGGTTGGVGDEYGLHGQPPRTSSATAATNSTSARPPSTRCEPTCRTGRSDRTWCCLRAS